MAASTLRRPAKGRGGLALASAGGAPRSPPDKPLGEFAELGPGYSSYRPARMGLSAALQTGRMRNPLEMQQSSAPWSARRPPSAGAESASSSRPAPRAQSAGRVRPISAQQGGVLALSHREGFRDPSHDFRGPEILQPQRIELPGYLNTPARRPDGAPFSPDDRTQAIRRIQDLELLTFACRRAAKIREEGRAHFSLGVLRDNVAQYTKAIESYREFLRVCKECDDSQGCALAYHCIGVDYQLMGGGTGSFQASAVDHASGAGGAGSAAAAGSPPGNDRAGSAVKPQLLRKAIAYHNKHRENTDSVGKFVAHLNMGLVYALLGEKEASIVNHQYALRYALQLHSLEGQTLAIGSLSFTAGVYENDPQKMRQLVEQYIELSGNLKQPRNQATALKKLGILASQEGDSEQGINYFKQAMEVAREQGDQEVEKDCCVRIGIIAGHAKMAEHLTSILQRSMVPPNLGDG